MTGTTHVQRGAGALIAVAALILLSACAPMRVYPSGRTESGLAALNSRSLPDITGKLPVDLRSSSDEVLVVIQTSRFVYSGMVGGRAGDVAAINVAARFMKGSELASLSQTITVDSGAGVVFFIPLMVTGIPLGGTSSYESLERLCIVAQDGRVVTLYPETAWQKQLLNSRRKEAIVAALHAGGNDPFANVDGPCGVHGTIEWAAELRAHVTEFIARVPALTPTVEASELVRNDPLATVLGNSWMVGKTPDFSNSGAMVLISVLWRGTSMAERPRFLAADDFDRFTTSRVTVYPEAVITLLPLYGSGSYDPSNLSVQSFCLISIDGRNVAAIGPYYLGGSEATDTKPRQPEWKENALSAIRRGSGTVDRQFPCIPPDTRNWSDADRIAAIRFIEAIPTTDGPKNP